MRSWKETVVAITGASSGIGRQLAIELARRGATVALLARRQDLLEALAETIRRDGGRARAIPCDVADRAQVERAIGAIAAEEGPIDVLVANAGVGLPTPAHRLDLDVVERLVRVNVLGVMYAVGAVLPAMLERGDGHLVAISSLAGWRGLPSSATYSATKAAVSTWMEGLRVELAPRGIRVTTVHPGFVRTPMTAKNDFPMPFLMDVQRAARIIVRGIEAGRRQINFPVPMVAVMRLARHLPDVVYDMLVAGAYPGSAASRASRSGKRPASGSAQGDHDLGAPRREDAPCGPRHPGRHRADGQTGGPPGG